jgi:hypothetical protein
MATLKAASGALLARDGHLCLTCCGGVGWYVRRAAYEPPVDPACFAYVSDGLYALPGALIMWLHWTGSQWEMYVDYGETYGKVYWTGGPTTPSSPVGIYTAPPDDYPPTWTHYDLEVTGPCP